MTYQEIYQSLEYYDVVFFIALLLQEHIKDFLSTLVCFFMSTCGALVIQFYQSLGCNYWEAAMFFEASLFCVSIFLIGTKLGWILFFVTTTSFFVNFGGYLMPSGSFYNWYQENYGFVNTIMFEILFWGCLVNSKLKPLLDKVDMLLQVSVKNKVSQWKNNN